MPRPTKTLARYGLRASDAVEADLRTIGLIGAGGSVDSVPEDGGLYRDPQTVLIALSRAGRPELAAQRLAELVTALRDDAQPPIGHSDGDLAHGDPPTQACRDAAPDDPAREMLELLYDDLGFRSRIIGLVGGSETLGEHVATNPGVWRALVSDDPLDEGVSHAECSRRFEVAAHDSTGSYRAPAAAIAPLRVAYRTRVAAIAAADLASAIEPGLVGPDLDDVCRALTRCADALLQTALNVACHHHPDPADVRLAVLAMGKAGARELNYVSDVDVLFVAGAPHTDLADEGELEPRMLAAATAQATEMMHICDMVAWEVDPNLRPEGRSGPLVRSLAAYGAYYARWAKTWEFQALLKARPAAGDQQLGDAFVQIAGPQVWSAADRDSFVPDVQAMRRRVEDAVPAADRQKEFKLGAGGLRDVEFAVQLLQLVHGRADESLRVPGTLAALEALIAGGYVGRRDGAELADAYTFQRRVEHLLQLQHLRRTHSLPDAPEDMEWLARTDGYPVIGRGGSGAGARLQAALTRHAATVRRLHEKLFYRPLLDAVAAVPTEELRLTPKAAANRLAALGFAAPKPALGHLAALTEGVSRRAAIQRTLLPVLLGTFADAPDPDAGLLAYRQVSDALASTPWFLRLLRDEGLVAGRLARLLGTSKLVATLLQRAPEVLRLLVHDAALTGADAVATSVVAASALQVRAARASDAVGAAAAARSARRHEMLRLACADLLGLAETSTVAEGLTVVADAVVRAALQASYRQVLADRIAAARHAGDDEPSSLSARVAVIGMGRFGGREMGYSSDADVLFVVEPAFDGADPAVVRADGMAVAEMTGALLRRTSPDPPLDIDTDLRPEGRSGPLVRSVASYEEYWRRNAQPWERQALLRARPVAGDDDVTSGFVTAIDPIRYPEQGLDEADVREIRRLKARMDAERLPRGADPAMHTKLGRGGLTDIEWTVQLIQLRYAGQLPELRRTETLATIDAATGQGILTNSDADDLRQGWLMATRARNAIMLVTGKSGDEIPAHGTVLAGIARACGYSADTDPGEFIDDYRRATRRARRVVDRLFDED